MSYFRKALLALAILPVAGCGLGDLMEFSCAFMDDSDHCYQSAAVQNADPDDCAKVTGEGFSGSNPPRDKCYLQIAENTGNYEVCKDIEGGMMSYTEEECVTNIAVKNGDPEGCKKLTGAAIDDCMKKLAASITADKLKEINDEVEKAKSEAGANPNDKDAQDRLKKLLAKQGGMFESAPESVKAEFMKSSREAILADVDDDDVKSETVHVFLDFRDKNPGMSLNDQLAKLQEIKDQQETTKRLDEAANTLMDQVKEAASGYATEKVDAVKGVAVDQGKAFLEAHGGETMKKGIAELEGLKEKYDKASEQYEKISGQIEKLKKVYDEVSEVYARVDTVNKMVAEGKIDPGRAKVLRGAIYLDKGLEYATKYVPVFGSTVSTISKETFNATIKFATKRAARTTAIDKCIDDPENCDPNGITPY